MGLDVVKNEWISRTTEAMHITHPDVDIDRLKELVTEIYKKRFKDTNVELYNNYENIIAPTTLSSMVSWFQERKPLIAESGVYFYQKSEKMNLNVKIIKEKMLDARTIHKAEKFEAKQAGDTFKEATKDLQQANDKKAANSGYGAEGEPSSFLFNIHSAMSVTASGRGQISNACQCFENLLGDNVKFFEMTEFFNYIHNIIHEKSEWIYTTRKVVPKVPSRDAYISRFARKFGHPTLCNETMLGQTYDYLDDELRIRTYYKANLREFLRLRAPCDLFSDIVCSKDQFINPNKPPEDIKDTLHELTKQVMEFVGYKYGVFRYEDRTRYQKRAVVTVIDTDSNFLALGDLYQYLTNEVLPVKMFKNADAEEDYHLKVINVLCNFATEGITERLFNYLDQVNVPEEDRHFVNMKNEFYNSRMIITFAKKSYIALQKRQENVVFTEPELDVKGVNFFKSTASEDTSKFIYDKVLMGELLDPPDGKISLMRTYKTIYDFQQKISSEIAEGNMGYLKRSIRVKTADGYADPMRIGQYKAVYVWNKIVKDKDQIKLPATVTIVKVELRNKQDAAALENWPDIYERVIKLFDTDPDIGDYMDPSTGKMKKGKGVKAIALPDEMNSVPDWLLAIIDTGTLVEDNMRLFDQLAKPLGFTSGKTSHGGSTSTYYTNIVRL